MTTHLVAISIGPVQDFISAARRTRDLWFGSHVLSEISKAAAKALHDFATPVDPLIFPAVTTASVDLLKPEDSPGAYNVGNVILALLPDGKPPKDAICKARQAAVARWTGYADGVRDVLLKHQLIDPKRWAAQIDDVVEFNAASVPLAKEGDYKKARARLMRLLAGRKACRDFCPPAPEADKPRLPKSSLDGARASVWASKVLEKTTGPEPSGFQFPQSLRYRIRSGKAEQLDAVGLVKRLGGTAADYPSISRIAADPWLRGGDRVDPDGLFGRFRDACAKLPGIAKLPEERFPKLSHFPLEGAVVYDGRLKDFEQDLADDQSGLKAVEAVRCALRALCKRLRSPDEPYLTVLVADGDRMGKAISLIEKPDAHRAFSSKLSEFAGVARRVVEKHHGCLIFSGGDDVIAFLPLDTALTCTRELHDEFGKLMREAAKLVPEIKGNPPTLSAGIAICHAMDPMEDLLDFARAAEKAAKNGKGKIDERDGLAVHLHTRGGAPVFLRKQWTENLDADLLDWAALFNAGVIPDKAAYDLQLLARGYLDGNGRPVAGLGTDAVLIRKDVLRLFKRKKGNQAAEAGLGEVEKLLGGISDAVDLLVLANQLVVARRIARALQQASPAETPASMATGSKGEEK